MGFFSLLARGKLKAAFAALGTKLEEKNKQWAKERQESDLQLIDDQNALRRLAAAQTFRQQGKFREAILQCEPVIYGRAYTNLSELAREVTEHEIALCIESAMNSQNLQLKYYGIAAAWRTLPVLDKRFSEEIHTLHGGEPEFYEACMALATLDECEKMEKYEIESALNSFENNICLLKEAGKDAMAKALEQRYADYTKEKSRNDNFGFRLLSDQKKLPPENGFVNAFLE